MDVQAVIAILSLAAAIFSTLWATGGWSALHRRSMLQELGLAKDLPESATKRQLISHVEEEVDLYLYRVREQEPSTKGPVSALALSVVVIVALASAFPDANIVVIYLVEGLFVLVAAWAYAVWLRSTLIKRSRTRRSELLGAARKVADT